MRLLEAAAAATVTKAAVDDDAVEFAISALRPPADYGPQGTPLPPLMLRIGEAKPQGLNLCRQIVKKICARNLF